jgi:hypothetical protein
MAAKLNEAPPTAKGRLVLGFIEVFLPAFETSYLMW